MNANDVKPIRPLNQLSIGPYRKPTLQIQKPEGFLARYLANWRYSLCVSITGTVIALLFNIIKGGPIETYLGCLLGFPVAFLAFAFGKRVKPTSNDYP